MRRADLFDEGMTPLKVAFWLQPHHWAALTQGMGAEEAEALRYEYQLIQNGQRDILGHPCLCGSIEKFPEAVRGGSNRHGDSGASIVGLVADLKRAADQVPLSWKTTRRVYWVQGRGQEWFDKVGKAYVRIKERSYDRMPDLGATHTYAWMAYTLGWRGSSRWPRRAINPPAGLHVVARTTQEEAA